MPKRTRVPKSGTVWHLSSEEATRWDASDYLKTEEDVAAYLNAAFEENDLALLRAALADVAKAQGMPDVARRASVGRESLYKSLKPTANPSFSTIVKVAEALGMRMVFVPASPPRSAPIADTV